MGLTVTKPGATQKERRTFLVLITGFLLHRNVSPLDWVKMAAGSSGVHQVLHKLFGPVRAETVPSGAGVTLC